MVPEAGLEPASLKAGDFLTTIAFATAYYYFNISKGFCGLDFLFALSSDERCWALAVKSLHFTRGIKLNLHKYTVKELRAAVQNSSSYRQVLIKLGVAAYGGNYEVLKKSIKYFNCDNSHFTGQAWSRGVTHGPRRELSEYLNNSFYINSHKLRLRLLREKVFEHICSSCKMKEWMNHPIPLELDHIDGNNKDNSLSNLRLLCPNCHAQTPTYRGKNKRKS